MSASAAPERVTWLTVLMTVLLFVNYVDRGNLATVGPLLIDRLGLSNAQLGLLLSAFYFTYAPTQLLAGWACERGDVYRLLALGVTAWSLTTAATGLAAGFVSLLLLRLLLGLGESVIFPGSSRLFAQLIPEARRGAANGWMSVGLAIGPAIGTYAGSLIAGRYGWQASFLLFGALSLLWLWPWSRFVRAVPLPSSSLQRPPRYREMLAQRAAWGAFLGHFSSNYSFYFLISWLPTYLVKVRGMSMSQMGVVGGLLFYTVSAVSSVAAGWYCDRLIERGGSVNSVRKACIVYAQLGAGACLAVCAINPALAIGALMASGFFIGVGSGPVYNIAQTLAGPRCAGQWVGVQNFFGNLAGIVAPYATGLMVDRSGHYGLAFLVAGAITFAGAAAWGWVIPKVEPLAWSQT